MRTFKNYFKIVYLHKFSIILLIVIFSFLLSINVSSSKDNLNLDSKINVVDNAKNKDSKKLVSFLKDNYKVSTKSLSEDEAKDLLFGSMTSYVLFIDESNNLSYYAQENSIEPVAINMKINEYLSTNRTLNKFNINNPYKNTVEILGEDVDFEIIDSSSKSDTEIYYTYLTYIVITVLLSVIFLAYHSFLKDGVQNRIRISKTKLSKFNLSLYMSSLIFMVILCIVFVLFEYVKNKSDISKVPLLFANLVVFAVPIVALAYIISSLSKNAELNGAMNNIVSLILCFISGAFIPQDFLPDYLLKISSIFPPYWYIKGITAVEKLDYNTLLKVFSIQIVMALVFIIINTIISKYRKDELSPVR